MRQNDNPLKDLYTQQVKTNEYLAKILDKLSNTSGANGDGPVSLLNLLLASAAHASLSETGPSKAHELLKDQRKAKRSSTEPQVPSTSDSRPFTDFLKDKTHHKIPPHEQSRWDAVSTLYNRENSMKVVLRAQSVEDANAGYVKFPFKRPSKMQREALWNDTAGRQITSPETDKKIGRFLLKGAAAYAVAQQVVSTVFPGEGFVGGNMEAWKRQIGTGAEGYKDLGTHLIGAIAKGIF